MTSSFNFFYFFICAFFSFQSITHHHHHSFFRLLASFFVSKITSLSLCTTQSRPVQSVTFNVVRIAGQTIHQCFVCSCQTASSSSSFEHFLRIERYWHLTLIFCLCSCLLILIQSDCTSINPTLRFVCSLSLFLSLFFLFLDSPFKLSLFFVLFFLFSWSFQYLFRFNLGL